MWGDDSGVGRSPWIVRQGGTARNTAIWQRPVTIPVTLTAVANVPGEPAGSQYVQQYQGTYELQRTEGGWRIESASVAPSAAVRLGSAEAGRLLSEGCR